MTVPLPTVRLFWMLCCECRNTVLAAVGLASHIHTPYWCCIFAWKIFFACTRPIHVNSFNSLLLLSCCIPWCGTIKVHLILSLYKQTNTHECFTKWCILLIAAWRRTTFIFFCLFSLFSPCGPFYLSSHSLAAPLFHNPASHVSLSLSGFNSPLSAVSVDEDDSLAIASQNVFNPGQQGANFGVNTRVARQSTALAPGDNAVQLPIAHQRTARVTLSAEEEEDSWGQVHDLIPSVFAQHVHILPRVLFGAACTSTWQASLPPSGYPAHTMRSVSRPG